MELFIDKTKIFLITLFFCFSLQVNSEENKKNKNDHEFNFYTGMFDFSDDGKRSTLIGILSSCIQDSIRPIDGVMPPKNSSEQSSILLAPYF